MRKVLAAVVLGVVLAGWLFACVQGWVVPSRTQSTALRIGFILPTMQEERYQKDRAYFIEAAEKSGAEVLFSDARNDGQIQIQLVEDMLSRGVKVMVISPVNSDTAKNLVALCHRQGVPVVAYDRIIKNCDLDMYVTSDSYKVGVLQAEAAARATGGKGNYAILEGTVGHSVANEITRGNKETLQKYPDIHVIYEQNHPNWAPDEALASTENLLTRVHNDLNAILCNNSGMARGAIQALRKVDLAGKVFVAGADADLDNCRYVLQGLQGVEVFKAIRPLATGAANTAVEMARGKAPLEIAKAAAAPGSAPAAWTTNNGDHEVPTINTEVQLVTKENLIQVVIDSGFQPRSKFEDLLGK